MRMSTQPRRGTVPRSGQQYFEAVDEARENVRLARRNYHDGLDNPNELKGEVGPGGGRESLDPTDPDVSGR